ncbi:ATP-binding cassette domain-containing protein [Streptomyces hygroscopicus]|uniref:ATP-binding cassette domain-containing protein n=1 Tax=Streptomyces hygroscopicus TaxID=1912 RepID=UPI000A3E6A2F
MRRAISYAVGRKSVINAVGGSSLAEPATTFLPDQKAFGYTPYDHFPARSNRDPEKARELLAKAGYAHGLTITLTHSTDEGEMGPSVAAAVQQSLEKAGIAVRLKGLEGNAYNERRWDAAGTPGFDGVSLRVARGETLGVVGESGSGKTTLGRMLVRLLEPSGGSIRYQGRELTGVHREPQMVFQDPVSSLNPRRSIGESVADPLRAAGALTDAEVRRRARAALERVGLDPGWYHRYPHEFSGGQRQRVGIARALVPEPRLIVCDEPVSALDVTTQAQVLDLLAGLQRDLGLALVLISHDLAVVRRAGDRVAVMRRGAVVEEGPADTVYDAPRNPYTKALLAAVPVLDPAEAASRRAARGHRPALRTP